MNAFHLIVTVYSHHFSLTKLSARGKWLALNFAKKYVEYSWQSASGQYTRVATRVFGAATENREEYRFHINQLPEFKRHLTENFTSGALVEWVIEEEAVGFPAEFIVKPKWVAHDYQVPIVEYLSNPIPLAKFVGLQTGKGKAQVMDASIKIPGGWALMSDMKLGTEVIAKDGSTTKVTGVFPQGKKEVYRITFADGRSTECCGEHLWKIFYINTSVRRRWQIQNTLEIKRLIEMPNPRVYIDLIDSEKSPDIDLPLDPYLLGVLLGDAHLGRVSIQITTPDEFIINQVKDLIPKDCKITNNKPIHYNIVKKDSSFYNNSLIKIIAKMGLSEKLSYNKFIPDIYHYASSAQRLALLQGLLDTDGTANTVDSGGSISFCSTSPQLAKSVQYLVRSLGGIASISLKIPHFTYKGEYKQGRDAYIVNIRYKKPSELFRLPKKKERTNDNNQYAADLKLRVKSVELIGTKETQCISIAHPEQLYVTDEFIVTHNTATALLAMAKIGKKIAVVIKPMYIEKWVEDFTKTYEIDPNDIVVIRGSDQLIALTNLAKEGRLTQKVFIFSNKTLQNWFSAYEKYHHNILDDGYACLPYQLFPLLNVGVRLIDEVHQDFHFNFKLDLYTHVEQSISLSATLVSNAPFTTKMHELAYPPDDRYSDVALDKYIDSLAVYYGLQEPDRVRTQEYGGRGYSHNAFEKSILKRKDFLKRYCELIDYVLQISYFKCERAKKKVLVFASSIDMCTYLTNYFKTKYSHLDVRRYVAEDPYENLIDSEMCFSTLGSSGTAHDLPNLTTVINTIAVDSIQANIQSLGRLRKLPDSATEFYYFVCEDIPQHIKYDLRKQQMLDRRAKSFRKVYTGRMI